MSDDGRAYKVALSGSLPGEQANGWDDDNFADTLDSNRAKTRYARIAYSVHSTKDITATGKKILTIQLQRIEPVPDDATLNWPANGDTGTWTEEQAITHLFEQRTGQTTLIPPAGSHE